MNDIALSINPDDATQADLSWDGPCTDISNNVWLSLMVRLGKFFAIPTFGSKLLTLQPGKNTVDKSALVKSYIQECLQWLLDLGRASAVDVQTEQVRRGINFTVTVTQVNGTKITYSNFVSVG